MPTYEYACKDCGEHLEVVQSFKDAPLTECGRCGGTLRKVFSAAGIIFKGSGYYVTDSRKAGSEGTSDGGSSSRSSDGAGGSEKTEKSSGTSETSGKSEGSSSGSSASSSSDSSAKSA